MKITIIGAGPAGLSLASLLQQKGVQVEIYEGEESFGARDQGGCIDMHQNMGQITIKAAGLFEQFKKLSRTAGETTHVLDREANILFEDFGTPPSQNQEVEFNFFNPEIDRLQLRRMFYESLTEGTVKWGKSVSQIEKVQTSESVLHKIHFTDGTNVNAEFIVGCDGAWSKVRNFFAAHMKPLYTGVTFIEAFMENTRSKGLRSQLLANNEGSVFALQDNNGIIMQRTSDNNHRIYAAQRRDVQYFDSVDFSKPTEARRFILKEFEGWHPDLLQVIELCENKFQKRHLYAMPLDTPWNTTPGVTIIGDSAHLMSPFAGQGANLALLDALDLSEIIQPNGIEFSRLEEFEKKMFERAKISAIETEFNLNACFTEGKPVKFVEVMKSHHE